MAIIVYILLINFTVLVNVNLPNLPYLVNTSPVCRRRSLDLGRESWELGEASCRAGCWGLLGERCPEEARSPAEGMGVMGFSGGKVGG